ncbi:MAG: ATP-binding protein [Planctomycetaceae bacterium]|jgi:transitional endoplasmic reticulum ATPase|nr:ATP-binding protein [Planctomycetaceae bacterium]
MTSWVNKLNAYIEQANSSLQKGNRNDASIDMAKASELLFIEAKKTTDSKAKKKIVLQASQLLETSLMLRGEIKSKQLSHDQQNSYKSKIPNQLKHAENFQSAKDNDENEKPEFSRGTTLKFADVAGLEEVKETLMQRVVLPFRFPDKLAFYGLKSGGGMLFYGPPGTGKTLLAKAVAGELGLPFYLIKSSEILSQYYGQSTKNLAELFEQARNESIGACVFFDEIDSIAKKRTDETHGATLQVLTQLLQELDGVNGRSEKIVFLAATNTPWTLDEAILRPPRFCEKCYVPLPDEPARFAMFEIGLKNCPIDPDLDFNNLVIKCNGLSGADIINICERAKLIPFTEAIQTGIDRPVNANDFKKAMQNIKPSVSNELQKKYNNW